MSETITFEAFTEQWLADIKSGDPSPTELGDRFARKLFTQWRDIPQASEDLIYCDGPNDGGIDLAYLERGELEGDTPSGDTWYLVQSKFGTSFQGEKTLLLEGQKIIDTLLTSAEKSAEVTRGVIERVNTFRRQAVNTPDTLDHLVLVFATALPLTGEDKRALETVRAAARSQLGKIVDVETISIETIYLNILDELAAKEAARLKLPLKARLTASGDNLWIGSVSLLDLYAFLKEYRSQTGDLDQLYEKNVRLFLGGRKKVNKGIRTTLQNEPEFFGLYNNGITVVVKQFDEGTKGTCHLTEPYIVNGCQTTRTIWEVFQQKLETGGSGSDPILESWRNRASQGVAVIKVVRVGVAQGSGHLLQDITRFTNSQNAVSDKDFITLETSFQQLKREMDARYGIFLEIQRGGWDSQRALQKQNPNSRQFKDSEWANAFDLIKVYGAGWLREAGTAFGRNAAFVPGGSIYKQIIDKADEPFGTEDLYAAFQLQRAAAAANFGRGSTKASRRQTKFLFYLIAIDILKDVLIRANLSSTRKGITYSLNKLVASDKKEAFQAFIDTAVGVVDEYLTTGGDDTVFDEPVFKDQDKFNNDLNAYLKWDRLGNSEDCPRLASLLAVNKRAMGRGANSPRDLIAVAVR